MTVLFVLAVLVLAVLLVLLVLEVVVDLLGGRLGLALRGGDQLGEHPGERVDLVAAELGAGAEVRRLLAEHALEAEHQRVADLPVASRLGAPGLDLGERVVERAAPRRSRSEHLRGVLSGMQERLARPLGRALCRGGERTLCHGHRQGLVDDLVHGGSDCRAASRSRKAPETPAGVTPAI